MPVSEVKAKTLIASLRGKKPKINAMLHLAALVFNNGRVVSYDKLAQVLGFEGTNRNRLRTVLIDRMRQMSDAEIIAKITAPRLPAPVSAKPNPQSSRDRDSFYMSPVWRKLRYFAIKLYGRTCMCCGAKNMPIHVDHIVPRSIDPGLSLDMNNLQILCEDCNMGKGNTDSIDYRTEEQKFKARYPWAAA